jgi:O-antigen/teichoic acid export membrane protein
MLGRGTDSKTAELKGASAATDPTILKRAYLWNSAGALLNAFQSVIMLMVLTRACDMVTAGVFTLAYANANLFLTMGNFGMRNFEASDVVPNNGFRAYRRARIITGTAMVLCSWAYLAFSAIRVGYSFDKILAVALMTVFKLADVLEDVFDANFQQQGRLDVGGRQMTLRIASSTLVFCIVSAVTKNLVIAISIATVFAFAFLAVSLFIIRSRYDLPVLAKDAPNQSALPLLKECFPLFVAAFLLFYVGNAPKWAIDAVMDDVAQAHYGFIAMPVFVVNLLSQFVYMPMVRPISDMWEAGDKVGFSKAFLRQMGIVGIITAVCVTGAAILGVPVLSLLYNTDLSPYRLELCALVFGGGFLALAHVFNMGITVMRRQKELVWGYCAVAVIAIFASSALVKLWGISGAALCYILTMTALSAWFGFLFWRDVKRGPSTL